MSELLERSTQSNGAKRFATPAKHLADLNAKQAKRSSAAPMPPPQEVPWFDPGGSETVVGGNVAHMAPDVVQAGYNVHYPIRRGRLNLHSGVGGSLTAVLADLVSIWGRAIESGEYDSDMNGYSSLNI